MNPFRRASSLFSCKASRVIGRPKKTRRMRLLGQQLEDRSLMAGDWALAVFSPQIAEQYLPALSSGYADATVVGIDPNNNPLASLIGSTPITPGAWDGSLHDPYPKAEVSAAYDPAYGVLTVVGTKFKDQIRVLEADGRLSVQRYKVNLLDISGNTWTYVPMSIGTPGGPVDSLDATGITKIEVHGSDGDDKLTFEYSAWLFPEHLPSSLVVEMFGGYGEDTLKVVSGGHAWLPGGDSDPQFALIKLDGGEDDDTLIGGPGDDTLYGGNGFDTLTGGAGRDFLYGGDGNDMLAGDDGDDSLYGEDGADTMYGDGETAELGAIGEDRLFGGAGIDTMYGDSGTGKRGGSGWSTDVLDGGDGSDIMSGQDGNDLLFGGGGHDELYGNRGDDRIYGDSEYYAAAVFAGFDYLDGGPGDDDLFGEDGDDDLYDHYYYGEHNNLYGGAGADTFFYRSANLLKDYEEGHDQFVEMKSRPDDAPPLVHQTNPSPYPIGLGNAAPDPGDGSAGIGLSPGTAAQPGTVIDRPNVPPKKATTALATWTEGAWTEAYWTEGPATEGFWTEGVWVEGAVTEGFWTDAYWTDGTATEGFWTEGVATEGFWTDGVWTEGFWTDGTSTEGFWTDGHWSDGFWTDGSWIDGYWGDDAWVDGYWADGYWTDGFWADGFWTDGATTDGFWTDGYWTDGYWTEGTWSDGFWTDGATTEGFWTEAVWTDGAVAEGYWTDAFWTDSVATEGFWTDGYWTEGYWTEELAWFVADADADAFWPWTDEYTLEEPAYDGIFDDLEWAALYPPPLPPIEAEAEIAAIDEAIQAFSEEQWSSLVDDALLDMIAELA